MVPYDYFSGRPHFKYFCDETKNSQVLADRARVSVRDLSGRRQNPRELVSTDMDLSFAIWVYRISKRARKKFGKPHSQEECNQEKYPTTLGACPTPGNLLAAVESIWDSRQLCQWLSKHLCPPRDPISRWAASSSCSCHLPSFWWKLLAKEPEKWVFSLLASAVQSRRVWSTFHTNGGFRYKRTHFFSLGIP